MQFVVLIFLFFVTSCCKTLSNCVNKTLSWCKSTQKKKPWITFCKLHLLTLRSLITETTWAECKRFDPSAAVFLANLKVVGPNHQSVRLSTEPTIEPVLTRLETICLFSASGKNLSLPSLITTSLKLYLEILQDLQLVKYLSGDEEWRMEIFPSFLAILWLK